MGLVGFGQPDDGIIQMAYVVPDIRQAIRAWVDKMGVGPWFVLDHFTGIDPKYRGGESKADVALAMSFAGHMNIELIQPNNDAPSVYREGIEKRGYGFHHWGRATWSSTAIIPPVLPRYSRHRRPGCVWRRQRVGSSPC
jgi:hypothetical protein